MDNVTKTYKEHYTQTFGLHGATSKGVDWGAEFDLTFRYDKMLEVMRKDLYQPENVPSLLDVGCGWGGLLQRIREKNIALDYTGIDVVEPMIVHARETFRDGKFLHGDIFDLEGTDKYDFVVCNGIITLRLGMKIPDMERYSRKLIKRMFELCHHGVVFNIMSTHVNFMVENLYYKNPSELLAWLLTEVTPRVRLDHGYSSLVNNRHKFFDYTVYLYKD